MSSPPSKRVKLEDSAASSLDSVEESGSIDDAFVEHCSICLQPYADRTVIPTCSHEFCFECLLIWTEQSRRCPLCSQDIGKYLMHHIRSKYDYQKHYLAPLRTSPEPQAAAAARRDIQQRAARRREVEWGRRRRRELEELDELERAIEKRRWVYRHHLYAKHVASNPYTRYRPFPTPAQFAASQDFISRATSFVRRELMVWTGLDVEFLTTFTISLMKSLDIRSEPAVRLLAEFLDMDSAPGHERDNAEHFAHELYCYLRSPFRDLTAYDSNVQYDVPPDIPPPDAVGRGRRWPSRAPSPPPSGSRTRERPSRSRSSSRPSSRRHSTSRRYTDRDVGNGDPRSSPRRDASPSRRPTQSRPKASDRTRSSDNLHHRPSPRQRVSNQDASPTGGARYLRDDLPREPRNSHHHGDEVDRKGKRRADDRVDASDAPSRPDASREEETTTASGSVRSGMQSNVNTRPPSHASSRDEPPSSSAVSTPPYSTDQSGTIAQNANDQSRSAAFPVTISVDGTDRAKSPEHPVSKSGDDELPGGSQKSRSEGRPPVRIRRNPWQAMQQYLADGAGGSRPTTSRNTISGSEPPSAAQSQAQRDAAVIPRDKALRPEDPSPPGEAVPSLLLRLSDPVPPACATSRNPSSGVPDATRAYPPAHEDGKRITASEMIGRTRATSDKPTAANEVGAGPSRTPRVQNSGTVRESQQSPHIVGGSDVSAVEQMSSENAAQPGGTTNAVGSVAQARYHALSTDPRSLLVQKLEAAKRDAADIPTAEKSQLSSAHRSSVPMASPHGRAGDPSKSAQDVETAERIAERREAELRIQAQLRVRLAAAKRTAQRSGSLVEGGTATSTATIDGDLAAQEVSLRDRLKSRQM